MENEIMPDKNVLLEKFVPIRNKIADDGKKLVWATVALIFFTSDTFTICSKQNPMAII